MCGIVGIFNYGTAPRDDRATLESMRDAMSHRGPDDAGVWQSDDRRVTLGHRRLSIIDLSPAGHQPMSNEDGSLWVTFNGEIYNHAALRRDVVKPNHVWRSRTDTEVLLHLYADEGLGFVRRLDGMFAFGLWDERRHRLHLVRDRLGKKPVYYAQVNGKLIFGSEIKVLLAHPELERDVDPVALDLFLTFSNVPSPWTLFKGVRKLPPGHTLTCDARGNLEIKRYWSILDDDDEATARPGVTEPEAVERVRELLGKAVEKRLMADVPVGCFLSGGVDSSTNVALMSRLVKEPLRTFSVGFHGFGPAENFHDLPFARQVADRFGCRHQEVMVSAQECMEYLPELARQQDEPVGDPACLPMHFVSRAAHADGIKVVLVGEGSDEVFGGYDDLRRYATRSLPRWRQLMRVPTLARAGLFEVGREVGRRLNWAPGRLDLIRRAALDQPFYWGLDVVFWDTEKDDLLEPRARAAMGPGAAPVVQGWYDELATRMPQADALQTLSWVELCNRLPELLLMRVDKLSMAHSLEARAPFLDYRLSRYAFSLPQSLKVSPGAHGATKAVLKKAVEPWLPSEVITRSKQGFRVPLPAWLRNEMAPWAEHLLSSSPLQKRGFFQRPYIEGMWQRHKAGVADHSFDLWCLLNLTAWYENWIERRPSA